MQKILCISSVVLSIVMTSSAMDKRLALYEQLNYKNDSDRSNFSFVQAMLNQNPKKALGVLDDLVKNNFPPAQHLLGNILKQGCYGVEKDEQKALEYYRIAAENNYPKSQFALVLHYLQLAAVPRPLAIKKRHIKGEPLSYSFYNEKVAQKMLNYLENTDKQVGYNKINYLMGQRSSQEACIIFERAFLDHITKDMFNSDTIDMFLSSGAYQTLTSIITDKKEHDFVKKQAQYVSGSFWYEALRCGLSEDQLNRLNIKYQLVDNNKNKKNLYELYHDKAYTLLKKANNSWAFLCLGEMIHSGYKPEQNQSSAYFFYQAFIHSKTNEKKEGLQKLALQHLKELANKGDIEAERYLNLLPDTQYIVKEVHKESSEEHTAAKIYELAAYNKPDINLYNDIEEIPCIIVPSYANYAQDYIYNHVAKEVNKELQDSYCAENVYQVTCKESSLVYEVAYKKTGIDLYNKGAYEEAFKYFEASKENQDIAYYYLAKMCFEGRGQEKSFKQALHYCGRFLNCVFERSLPDRSCKIYLNKILKMITTIAESSNTIESRVMAQYYMGINYLNNYLIKKDKKVCLKNACAWLLKAEANHMDYLCEKDSNDELYLVRIVKDILEKSENGELAYILARMYLTKKEVSDNDIANGKQYLIAAEKYGFARADANEKKRMADMYYELALCVRNNISEVQKYFDKALSFNKKHPFILFERGIEKFDISLKQKGKEEAQAGYSDIVFAAKHDEMGIAQYWLADAFLKGRYDKNGVCKIKQNISTGMKWLEKAVKNNSIDATLNMADLYRKGTDTIKKDINKAIEYVENIYNMLADEQIKKFPSVPFLLAVCYYEKALALSDITEKKQLFVKAHDLFVDLLAIEQMPVVNLYLAKMHLASYGVDNKQEEGLTYLELFFDKVKVNKGVIQLIYNLDLYQEILGVHGAYVNTDRKKNFLCGLIAYYIGSYDILDDIHEINRYFTIAKTHFLLIPKEAKEYITLRCYLVTIMLFKQVVIENLNFDKENIFAAGKMSVQYLLEALNSTIEEGNIYSEQIKEDIILAVAAIKDNLTAMYKNNHVLKPTIQELFQEISKTLKSTKIVHEKDVAEIIRFLDDF